MKLFIVLLIVVLSGCCSYRVFTHDNSSDPHNHYVVVKHNWFTGNQTVYDCYSKPDSLWYPQSKEVLFDQSALDKNLTTAIGILGFATIGTLAYLLIAAGQK